MREEREMRCERRKRDEMRKIDGRKEEIIVCLSLVSIRFNWMEEIKVKSKWWMEKEIELRSQGKDLEIEWGDYWETFFNPNKHLSESMKNVGY